MRLKERVEDDVHVFALGGEIDFHYAPVLRAMLQAKVKAHCPALILDFSDVEFIDSRGIAAIIEYFRDCADHGGRLCLAALNPEVKPIIDVVRLDLVMPIFNTVPEAVAGMKNGAGCVHGDPHLYPLPEGEERLERLTRVSAAALNKSRSRE